MSQVSEEEPQAAEPPTAAYAALPWWLELQAYLPLVTELLKRLREPDRVRYRPRPGFTVGFELWVRK